MLHAIKKSDFGHSRNEVLPASLYSSVLCRGEFLAFNVKLKRTVNIKKQHGQLELNIQDETLT